MAWVGDILGWTKVGLAPPIPVRWIDPRIRRHPESLSIVAPDRTTLLVDELGQRLTLADVFTLTATRGFVLGKRTAKGRWRIRHDAARLLLRHPYKAEFGRNSRIPIKKLWRRATALTTARSNAKSTGRLIVA